MATTAGLWQALRNWYVQHRRPVAHSNELLYATPQAQWHALSGFYMRHRAYTGGTSSLQNGAVKVQHQHVLRFGRSQCGREDNTEGVQIPHDPIAEDARPVSRSTLPF